MRRIAGEVDWLVRSFGVGGFGLRVAGLVLLSRREKMRSTAPAALGRVASPTRCRFLRRKEEENLPAVHEVGIRCHLGSRTFKVIFVGL